MISAKDFGIQVMHRSGDEEYCLCPFHSDHSASASFSRTKGLFVCYVCGVGYNLVQLQEKMGVALDLNESDREREPEDYDLLDEFTDYDLGEETYAPYFEERGIPPAVIRSYGVRWSERQRAAVLPLRDLRGHLQGAAYRYLSGPTRYRVMGKLTPVWPMPLLDGIRASVPIIVVEGSWSAMRLCTLPIDWLPLALLGAKAGRAVVNLLRSFRVTFLYDGDAAGERACHKMRELFPAANAWTLSTSPDDMSEDQLNNLTVALTVRGVIG